MKRPSYRPRRVAELIKQEISNLLLFDLKDPRLHNGLVTVVDVTISRDLSVSKVFVSVLEEGQASEVMKALESAKGFIKREIGKRLSLRIVPEMIFVHDSSIKDGMRLSNLIESVNSTEEKADD